MEHTNRGRRKSSQRRGSDGTRLGEWERFKDFGFAPDNKRFWTLGEDKLRHVFELPKFDEAPIPETLAPFTVVHFQPGGPFAIAGEMGSPPESWSLIDGRGRKMHPWLPRTYAKVLAWQPWINRQDSLAALDDGTLRLFDAVEQKERGLFRLPAGEKVIRLDASPDRTCTVAITNTGSVLLFRLNETAIAQKQ